MASAKKEAIKYLGNENDYINLTGLNKERDIANQVYNTNATSFQNAYNDLLSTIASNRQKARTDFSSGRGTVSENAYMRNRESISDLASRGLNGGLAQLSKLGNRMETGRQYSDLANTYYNTLNELDATQRTGENEYNTNIESAKNTLSAALADIGTREANARNAYKGAVAQLAEQIQARKDAAAAAAASLALQRKALAEQRAQNKSNAKSALISELTKALGKDTSMKNVGNVADTYRKAIAAYEGKSYKNDAEARNAAMKFMYNAGLYNPNNWTATTAKPASSSKKTATSLVSLLGPVISGSIR